VLFVSSRDGNSQIYLMNADGSSQQVLTSGKFENTDPAWSPDGKRIAFTSYRDGNGEIYVMEADGQNQKRLTDDHRADSVPAWTPDGRIVFRSMRDRYSNFFIVNQDGSNLQRLTEGRLDKGAPLVSPDGTRVAFIGIDDKDKFQTYVVPIGGGEAKCLTCETKEKKYSPAWSPDGKRIAYAEYKNHVLNIHVVDAEGSNHVQLTNTPLYSNSSPFWSPDGQRIAFVSSREGNRMDLARGDVYVMNADGSGEVNLTRDPEEDNYPAWSSDGKLVYFISLRDGYAQIYSVKPDGSEQQRVLYSLGNDLRITPQPRLGPNGAGMLGVSEKASPQK
jgi:TolB protein